MAHKYPNILIHLVFSTKERRDLIPIQLHALLWKYLAGIGRNHKIPVFSAGGTEPCPSPDSLALGRNRRQGSAGFESELLTLDR